MTASSAPKLEEALYVYVCLQKISKKIHSSEYTRLSSNNMANSSRNTLNWCCSTLHPPLRMERSIEMFMLWLYCLVMVWTTSPRLFVVWLHGRGGSRTRKLLGTSWQWHWSSDVQCESRKPDQTHSCENRCHIHGVPKTTTLMLDAIASVYGKLTNFNNLWQMRQ